MLKISFSAAKRIRSGFKSADRLLRNCNFELQILEKSFFDFLKVSLGEIVEEFSLHIITSIGNASVLPRIRFINFIVSIENACECAC